MSSINNDVNKFLHLLSSSKENRVTPIQKVEKVGDKIKFREDIHIFAEDGRYFALAFNYLRETDKILALYNSKDDSIKFFIDSIRIKVNLTNIKEEENGIFRNVIERIRGVVRKEI
ncbi:hypothetical protein CCZ01_10050, partial [Helicobacter monodelphidis]